MTVPRYEPMLASVWPEPFSDLDWTFELKFDGVRTLLYWDGNRVELRSRRGREVTATYPELGSFSAGAAVVLDGEIVALDPEGRPSFERLQGRMNLDAGARVREAAESTPISYVVFDVLFDGVEVIDEPIEERRARLAAWELEPPFVPAEVVLGDGEAMWAFVAERGIEGMVAKRNGSRYRPGVRSKQWRKVSSVERIRAVVGGYTPGERGRSGTFGSLLIGLFHGAGLRWIGSVGTGFRDEMLVAIREALDDMSNVASPFLPDPELPDGSVWTEPQLVALVEFKEWTAGGRLRAPSFKGFTDDDPATVTWESEGPAA